MNAIECNANDGNDGDTDDALNENCVAESDAHKEVVDEAEIAKDEVKMKEDKHQRFPLLSYPREVLILAWADNGVATVPN